MRCLGVGAVPIKRQWRTGVGGLRRADTDTCPVCGREGIAPRKDGRVRVHQPAKTRRPSLVGQLDEHLQREQPPRRRRVITQK